MRAIYVTAAERRFEVARALIAARLRAGLTQGEVARLEAGNSLPSLKSLYRYAAANGTRLRTKFIRRRGMAIFAVFLGTAATTISLAKDIAQSVEAVARQAPGTKPMRLQDEVTMLDTITENGQRLLILKGTRKAGTRAAVHIHPHAGHTCVISGTITALIEGREPLAVSAGKCFHMPANVPMSAANLGKEDAVLIDTFILQPGQPEMTLLENYP